MTYDNSTASGFIIASVLVGFYLLPSIVAYCRYHHNAGAIFILNFFLGWTFLGWVISLVWASTQVNRKPA